MGHHRGWCTDSKRIVAQKSPVVAERVGALTNAERAARRNRFQSWALMARCVFDFDNLDVSSDRMHDTKTNRVFVYDESDYLVFRHYLDDLVLQSQGSFAGWDCEESRYGCEMDLYFAAKNRVLEEQRVLCGTKLLGNCNERCV